MSILARRIQARLDSIYGVETPDVTPFVRPANDGREVLEVREGDDGDLELALYLPSEALADADATSLDLLCQVAEGVSHFVYIVERSRRGLPATQLELELQAEVDKFVVLAASVVASRPCRSFPAHTASALRERLFGRVRFLHPEGTEPGERYRLANSMAARFVRSLEGRFGGAAGSWDTRHLRRFFESGQREKIEMVLAA